MITCGVFHWSERLDWRLRITRTSRRTKQTSSRFLLESTSLENLRVFRERWIFSLILVPSLEPSIPLQNSTRIGHVGVEGIGSESELWGCESCVVFV